MYTQHVLQIPKLTPIIQPLNIVIIEEFHKCYWIRRIRYKHQPITPTKGKKLLRRLKKYHINIKSYYVKHKEIN